MWSYRSLRNVICQTLGRTKMSMKLTVFTFIAVVAIIKSGLAISLASPCYSCQSLNNRMATTDCPKSINDCSICIPLYVPDPANNLSCMTLQIIKQAPRKIATRVGDEIELLCIFNADVENIAWLKNGNHLQVYDRYLWETSSKGSKANWSLRIKGVNENDAAIYVCTTLVNRNVNDVVKSQPTEVEIITSTLNPYEVETSDVALNWTVNSTQLTDQTIKVSDSSTMSIGKIAGIVIGVFVIIGIGLLVGIYFKKWCSMRKARSNPLKLPHMWQHISASSHKLEKI